MSRKEEQEYVKLGWKLIEWKVAYYMPESVHETRKRDYEVTDETYDAAEVEYLTACRKLNRRNTIVHKAYPGFEDIDSRSAMVEVDTTRPSVALVIRKLSSPKD